MPDKPRLDPAIRQQLDAIQKGIGDVLAAVATGGQDAEQRILAAGESLKQTLATVSADAAARAEVHRAEVVKALESSGVLDPERIAGKLRTIGDWIAHRTPETAPHIDALLGRLEESLGVDKKGD